MHRKILFVIALLIGPVLAAPAQAQDWRPSWRAMPAMPSMGDLEGDWLGPRSTWFSGTSAVSGIEPSTLAPVGQARRGSAQAQVVHFNNGPLPVVVWQDRNADGTADIVEIYRQGGVIVQVIDADYDGQANVLRVYDAGGTLNREERL